LVAPTRPRHRHDVLRLSPCGVGLVDNLSVSVRIGSPCRGALAPTTHLHFARAKDPAAMETGSHEQAFISSLSMLFAAALPRKDKWAVQPRRSSWTCQGALDHPNQRLGRSTRHANKRQVVSRAV
jgi:hypothetical protein